MAKPTLEQMAEFKRWNEQRASGAVSSEVIRSVIDDDVEEAKNLEKMRAKGRVNREYNAKFIPPAAKRETKEEK